MGSKKSAKSAPLDVPETGHGLFAFFMAVALILAMVGYTAGGAVYRFLNAPVFGMFELLTVLFYGIAAGLAGMRLYEGRAAGRRVWAVPAGLLALALFMIGEEMKWGFALSGMKVLTVADFANAALGDIPEGSSLSAVGVIAVIRLGLLFAVLYGIGLALYFAAPLKLWLKAHYKDPAFLYALAFAGFLIPAFLMDTGHLPGGRMFEEVLEMGAGLAVVFVVPGKNQYSQ